MTAIISTRTAIGGMLNTNRQLGLNHTIVDYSTVNQALSQPTIMGNLPAIVTQGMEVLPSYDPELDTTSLTTMFLVFGNGGHGMVTDPNTGVPYDYTVRHSATDTSLYNYIPLIARPITSDLTADQRKNYGLRRTLTVNNVLYAFYFGFCLDPSTINSELQITTITNGVKTVEDFIPTINNQKPTPPTTDVTYTGNFTSCSASASVTWTQDQVQDVKDAVRILYGKEDLAIISEVGICSGVKKPITSKYPTSGTQTPTAVATNTYYEIVACQIVMFVNTYTKLSIDYKFKVDLGSTEPLF